MRLKLLRRQHYSKREAAMKTLGIVAITAFAFLGLANFASAQFQVSSTTFKNNDVLPIEVIDNSTVETPQGTFGNECAPNFEGGGKQSPALSWTNVPFYTQSFVVIAFDATAQVYHWGMYNIPRGTMLPENASALALLPENAGKFGEQVRNYSRAVGYIGPCPPRGEPPLDHDYVFTVYALRRFLTEVDLPKNSDAEALQRKVTGRLAEASITGRWSSTRPPPPTPPTP
jgi:Raf kinase inhibitor-like YbhB/YbcL family protein